MRLFAWMQRDQARPLLRLRFADEAVGLIVLLCIGLFVGAIAEAGLLRAWLTPPGQLRLELPPSGLAGLAPGDDVQVMGVHAGTIRTVTPLDASHIYALAEIDTDKEALIRTDSKATIRRQFVVAGASYIDISRGRGAALDWSFAELAAVAEPNPVDTINHALANLAPVMDNLHRITGNVDAMLQDMRAGKGSVGALLATSQLSDQLHETLASLDHTLTGLPPLEDKISGLVGKGDRTMANFQATSADLRGELKRLSGQFEHIAGHVNDSTTELPALITQAQTAAASLEKLSEQMRSLWLLGGNGAKPASKRLGPGDVSP